MDVIWPELKDIHTIAFDFDGVFTNNKVYLNQDGQETVRCDRSDGLGIDFLRAYVKQHDLDVDYFIVSAEKNPVVQARAKKLKMGCRHGERNKLKFLQNYLSERNVPDADPFAGLIYLGNDLNDLLAVEKAGFSVVPEDAHPMLKELSRIYTMII